MASCFGCFKSQPSERTEKLSSKHKSSTRQPFAYVRYDAQSKSTEPTGQLARNPLLWTCDDCSNWLIQRDCPEAAAAVKQRNIDGEALVVMGINQLRELGVPDSQSTRVRQALRRRYRQSSRLSRDVLASFGKARTVVHTGSNHASAPTSQSNLLSPEDTSVESTIRDTIEQEQLQVSSTDTGSSPALRALGMLRLNGVTSLRTPSTSEPHQWAVPRTASLPPNSNLPPAERRMGSAHTPGQVGRPAGFHGTTLMLASMPTSDVKDTGSPASSPAFSRRGHSERPGSTGSGLANSRPISASLDETGFGFDSIPTAGAAHPQLRHSVGAKLEQVLDTSAAHPTMGLWIDQDIKQLVTGSRQRTTSTASPSPSRVTIDSTNTNSVPKNNSSDTQSIGSNRSRSSSTSSASSFFRSLGKKAGRSLKKKVQHANMPSPAPRQRGLTLDTTQSAKMAHLASDLSPSDAATSLLF